MLWRSKRRAAGSTTLSRILICHSDERNGPCNGSVVCEIYRNSPPFILPFATVSTRKDRLRAETPSSWRAPLLLQRGISFFPFEFGSFAANWDEFECEGQHRSPDRKRRFDRALHLTFWHVGERDEANTPEDYGLAFSGNWLMDSGWMSFIRSGISKGRAARADRSITVGTLFRPENKVGEFGFAFGWERISDATLGQQRAAEAFFRWDVTDNIQITPSMQAILDTPLSQGSSTKLVFGLRTRLTFCVVLGGGVNRTINEGFVLHGR